MQQFKATILCTRPIDPSLINEAASKGFCIKVDPFITTEPIFSIEVQQEIEQALLLTAPVVFTSMNAVEAVAMLLLEEQKPSWQIYSIGHATLQSVKKYFGNDLVAGTADDAEALADIIIDNSHAEEVFFFCGDQHRMELPSALRKNGIEVNEIVVYRTIPLPHKIDKEYEAILFFSPSAVKSFFEKNQLKKETILFAIGNTTATEIKKYLPAGQADSTNKIIISDTPAKKSLLEKAIMFFEAHSIDN